MAFDSCVCYYRLHFVHSNTNLMSLHKKRVMANTPLSYFPTSSSIAIAHFLRLCFLLSVSLKLNYKMECFRKTISKSNLPI